jgi:hypothetical protein
MKENEKLLYQANAAPSGFAMLFLIFNTWQCIFTLNTIDVAAGGIRVMEVILMNIFLSFLVFITAFEIKRYSLRWSWAGLGIGIFQCIRIFIAPVGLRPLVLNIFIPLLAAGIFLIIASVWSLVKCGRYRMAKKEQSCHTSA